jgi:hypothetical protein
MQDGISRAFIVAIRNPGAPDPGKSYSLNGQAEGTVSHEAHKGTLVRLKSKNDTFYVCLSLRSLFMAVLSQEQATVLQEKSF